MKNLGLFVIVNFWVVVFCEAQEIKFRDGSGFSSVFQNVEQGEFTGVVNGMLHLMKLNGTEEYYSFSDDIAKLSVIPDTNKIYDVSFKNYLFGDEEFLMRYSTYNRANALTMIIDGLEFSTTLIDGACELVLAGLDYEYIDIGNSELLLLLLLLLFNDDIGLSPGSCNTTPQLFIKKGSTLIVSIEK